MLRIDNRLLYSILDRCISPECWSFRMTAADLNAELANQDEVRWPEVTIEGHIELLVDGGYIEIHPRISGLAISRVTLSGHIYHRDTAKTIAMRTNPFVPSE